MYPRIVRMVDPNDPNDELNKLWNQLETEVSPMHPLEIYIHRDTLISIIEDNLATIRESRREAESDVERTHADALTQQRVEFLAYLRSERQDAVFVAMYPVASEDSDPIGIEDEDEDGDLP